MNSKFALAYMEKDMTRISHLFNMYQLLELVLFLKLYPAEIITSSREVHEFEKLNEKLDFKTLGKMTKKYNKKYPKDEYKLLDLLITVTLQRNNFMHSFFVFLCATKNEEEAMKYGKIAMDDFEKNVNALIDVIRVAEFV